VVYDAEDRPEPGQLRSAAATLVADAGLAVVQARLACDHAGPSAPWVTRMWALDYDCLFGAVNPALARLGLPYLLGGTSNHFRRNALASVGGWDAHNVTEDADLSVRLVRAGWRCGVVDSTTWEEAPVTAGAWVRQRSRWLKGFAVTTVVHARDPVRLWREAGPRATLALWAQLPGTLLCVAAYPVGVALACAGALDPASPLTWSMAGGHLASLALTARVAGRGRRRLALTLPAYWALLAWALAVGLLELPRRAGHWAKTEHGVAAGRPVVATVAEVRGDAGLAGSG
jgi:cellulose synthase/poly-beta-1,6-N-acetylglucosamine synthase-like glycosyltransferase